MKVPKSYLGKLVEIQWADPNSWKGKLELMKVGRAALATWKEYGIVMDITDGVVILSHSTASEPGGDVEKPDELERTAIHEALIERITVYAPTAEQPQEGR